MKSITFWMKILDELFELYMIHLENSPSYKVNIDLEK